MYKKYDSSLPLISIHIPKCGGTSLKEILKEWFQKEYKKHQFDKRFNLKPRKHRLTKLFSSEYKSNICIHGHFNRERNYGLEHYYPDVNQFITFLRDPAEILISTYYYNKKLEKNGIKHYGEEISTSIDEYFLQKDLFIKQHLPVYMNSTNYKEIIEEKFIYIGILEDYQKSINQLANIFTKNSVEVPHLNISDRAELPSENALNKFKERHEYEYKLYEYVKELNSNL